MRPSAFDGCCNLGIPASFILLRRIVLQYNANANPPNILPTDAVAGVWGFLRIEVARRKLRVYHGEYGRNGSLAASSGVAAEDLDADVGRDLDNGVWDTGNLESTPGGPVVGLTRKTLECYRCI